MDEFFVYILRCGDGSYYVGSTRDIEDRLRRHHSGEAARWTAERPPITLVYQETQESELLARRREIQIKGWTRAKKEKLISGVLKQATPPL